MFNKEEFRKYAVKHLGMGGHHLDKYMEIGTPNIHGFTPQVIEERQMNIVGMDVFSRLMMDRIIFLGVPIDDYVANIIQAQLLFLDSVDPNKDIQIYLNTPGGMVYAGLGIYDTIQYVSSEVATICTGMAASMGAILLCSGAKGKRTALKHARVLIHQPPDQVGFMMKEIVRCSNDLVMCMEYEASEFKEVDYRGEPNSLWKGPYTKMYMDMGLEIITGGVATKDQGWDDVTVASCFSCNITKGTRRFIPPSWEHRKAELEELTGYEWRVFTGEPIREVLK